MKNLTMVLAFILTSISSLAFAKTASVYTSVDTKDCKTIEGGELDPDSEIDHYTGHCAGKDGYTVVVSGGDLRYALSLIIQGEEIKFTNIGAFHDMGSKKIEWRGNADASGRISKFDALIYRLTIANPDGQSSKETLYVVRLDGKKTCLIGEVQQAPNMNAQARAIADDLARPCL